MIRLAQSQHGDAKPVEHRAKSVVCDAVGVPMRQPHHRALSFRGKAPRIDQVILWIRSWRGRSKAQELAFTFRSLISCVAAGREEFNLASFQTEIFRRLVTKEFVAAPNQAVVQVKQVALALFLRSF